MSEYYRGDEERRCEKCGKLMSLTTDNGWITWYCPEHGKEWKIENEQRAYFRNTM